MKRTISILLALTLCLLTLLPLSGCKKEEAGPLRILMDVPDKDNPYKMESSFKEFLELAEEKGGPTDIEVEWMPPDGEERKGALTRLRTEVMAGRGPDLFIIVEGWWQGDSLFPYPEKSMMNNLFLNLDKYMDKSQFTEWEYQNETILAAGRTDKGQYIIPMTYSLPVTCFREGDTDHVPDPSHNWKEMAGSADLTEQISCFDMAFAAHQSMWWGNDHLCEALGKLADFDKEELLFTEEDLEFCIKKKLEVMETSEQQGTFDSLPPFFQAPMCPGFLDWSDNGLPFGAAEEDIIPQDEPMTIVPHYSIQGGAAACIKSYAMIGNYTKRPKDAYFLLDLFMSREVQNGSFVTGKNAADGVGIGYVCYNGSESGLPLDSRNVSIPTANQEAVGAVLDTITQVNYYDSMYDTLEHLLLDCHNILTGWTEGDMDELIHETYRELAMSVKES